MAYVAVSGGKEAIEKSIELLDYYRSGTDKDIEVEAIENKLSLLVDRVMGEASLYAKSYAALALKQCEGSPEEAVFLLRAYRSTLTRNYYTTIVDTADMRVIRRISAAFKDITGGQILGATYDYTHRLINFDIDKEDPALLRQAMQDRLQTQTSEEIVPCPRVSAELKKEGLIDSYDTDDTPPHDVTVNMLEFPATRSARLQTLARADTGFICGLAYSVLRGFGQVHPTVGELRSGYVELYVPYLGEAHESIYIGEILITEVECFNTADDHPGAARHPSKEGSDHPGAARHPSKEGSDHPDAARHPSKEGSDHPGAARHPSNEGSDQLKLAVGYGAVFGRNENKAIAMAVVDHELNSHGPYPTQNEEFVLMHGDSLEMNGFISHLKLPHYVTFQSKLDAVRKTMHNS